jgi:erythromycin esterase
MTSGPPAARRTLLRIAGAVGLGVLAGCTSRTEERTTSTRTATDAATAARSTTTDGATTADATATGSGTGAPVDALERRAVPFELTASSTGLDAVAARLAETPVVGVGENSHGIAELKTIPRHLVRRLVGDHGVRLVAMEGTLGEFEAVDRYVTRGEGDLEAAMSSLRFYFWRTEDVRRTFEWLRSFNEGRPETERVRVRGYDAQRFAVNARAIRSYLDRVDPAYLDDVSDALDPLATPEEAGSSGTRPTAARERLVETLDERLAAREDEYVAESSRREWRLVRRHVRTLERGLRFHAASRDENFTEAKTIRDRAMAANVLWLREWTDADRVVVLGNSNHTMRGYGSENRRAARMGQHLSDELGAEYYSLGMLFGTGSFAAPKGPHDSEFGTFEVDEPVDDTLSAALADVSQPKLFLDFERARRRPAVDDWMDDVSRVQFTAPRFAERGALPVPASPGEVYDGVTFVREGSPASFRRSG